MKRRRIDIGICSLALALTLALESYAFQLLQPLSIIHPRITRQRNLPTIAFVADSADTLEASTGEAPAGGDLEHFGSEGLSVETPPLDAATAEDGIPSETIHAQETPFYASVIDTTKTDVSPTLEKLESSLGGKGADVEISRREWLRKGTALLFGAAAIGAAAKFSQEETNKTPIIPTSQTKPLVPTAKMTTSTTTTTKPATATITKPSSTATKSPAPKPATTTTKPATVAPLEHVNFTKVAAETNINITLASPTGELTVDPKNFTKIETSKVPDWVPSYLKPLVTPKPKAIKVFSNSELLVAATVAGSFTEMARTSLLYPIQTIKTRVQTDVHNRTLQPRPFDEQLVSLGNNIKRHVNDGNLYAGITPSLLVSVPATGVYYGIRDVTKRMLSMTVIGDVAIALSAALVADVVSLCFRAPGDALALRLQAKGVFSWEAQDEDVGDWFGDSLKRLPMIIVTDLPYLLSKIFLNKAFIHGSVSIDRYVEYAFVAAVVAAFLTTPFDVARTRILIDSDGDFSNGQDGGSGEGVLKTMQDIMREGDGGIQNLFAGWLERVLYYGIGRAWLEPIQIIGYVGIRDAVLLEWF